MNIDMIYIINLEHRKDRKEKMIQELKRVGIHNYEFFKGVVPSQEDIQEWNPNFINPPPEWFIKTGGDINKYRIGSLGCMKSHYEIIKKAYENNYENIFIMEDDTKFLIQENFNVILNQLKPQIEKIKNDFGILYFSGNHLSATIKKISPNISFVQGTLTTGCYIINRRAMKAIIDDLNHFPREIDVYYSDILQNKIPCFCFIPHLTTQYPDYSDILHKNTSYNLSSTIHH
jgi:GR25 family glycosyltransferase involved in LPS biosynthesis